MVSDTQRFSYLLSLEENEEVVRLLGERCQPLVMSVVQVFQTVAPDHGSWRKRDAGVLVLVKDNTRRSYFFRLYCLSRRQLVWEHEVYSNMEYNTPRPFFHMFEAEDCVTAFNFADEKEAQDLDRILKENMAARQRRRQERKRQASQNTNVSNHLSSQHSVSTPQLSNGSLRSSSHHRKAKGKKDKRRQAEKKKISKADIGLPQDFRHVSHVGWDPVTGFDLTNEKEGSTLKQFFAQAGVSDTQLKDKNTRDFIYDFIKNHGGLDRVKDEVQSPELPLQSPDKPPPPVPARTVQSSASIRTAPPPPPPPSRNQLPPPPPPSQAAAMAPAPGPPPPPPIRTMPQRQDPSRGGPGSAPTPPPPPPMAGVPAPPPPPPPMSASASAPLAAPAAPAGPAVPAARDARSDLMDAIKSGIALKPVTREEKSQNGTSGDSREGLLKEIRMGKELRPVGPASRPVPSNSMPSDSLAQALQRALEQRLKANCSDSSGTSSAEDDDDDDDDEWE